jgi:general L-amino acid transport system substrate-binding protein
MIMVGKVFIALIWSFWLISSGSIANGAKITPHDHSKMSMEERRAVQKAWKEEEEKPKPEYIPTYSTTYDRVIKRGYVICGTNDEFPGFSQEKYTNEDGVKWTGFDVDMCRAVAAAVFGDADAIEFEIVNGKTRFEFLRDGSIDVLSAATTYTYTRNVLKKLEFMPTTYYDGQGFIVRKTLGVSSAKQMQGARICFSGSGTAAKNIADFMKLHGITYIPVSVKPTEKTKNVYKRGDCDMYGTDRSGLASNRLSFDDPTRHMILPEIISKEPLGPVVKYGDQKWSDIVRWTIYVLFIAEEMGINSHNIDHFIDNIDPNIQRFMGEKNGKDHPHLGSKLGLEASWSYNVIKLIGNYKEIYERNVGKDTPIGLARGLNKLYIHGGLLYAPPLK